MSEQNGKQSSTKQCRSRKTNTANHQNGKQAPAAHHPSYDDKKAWIAYWKAQGQPWRIEPEIDIERQKYLAERRNIIPDVEKGIYPFKGITLSRADVEWLLATHENGRGPVNWSDESQREREGLDLRGADLFQVNLCNLPLACMRGGLNLHEWSKASEKQIEAGAIHLESADLRKVELQRADMVGAHLEQANLQEAHLGKVNLRNAHLEEANLSHAHLKNAILIEAHLERTVLVAAHLERSRLLKAHLEGADIRVANLKEARLIEAHLEGANLRTSNLEEADLRGAYLEKAVLYQAHLEHTWLNEAHLEGTNLRRAHLEGADLSNAHLEGKEVLPNDLERVKRWLKSFIWPEREKSGWEDYLDFPAILPPADLREAFFDSATRLNGASLGNKEYGFVAVADISWGGINLAIMNWWLVTMLGDERIAKWDNRSDQSLQISNYEKAVRANRQLATALQDQGLHEEASYFSRRAQILRRKLLWLMLSQKNVRLWLRVVWSQGYIFSWFLDILSGYGYKPQRSLISYVLVITTFSISYYVLGLTVGPHFSPLGALVFSVTSFHGRGFFPGGVQLDDPITSLAALEAMVGLAIEVSLIATFTQRFFGK